VTLNDVCPVTVRVTGTTTLLTPEAESRTFPVYAVDDAASPDGFTDTVRVPLFSDADNQFPPDGVVTMGVTVTGRLLGLMVTDTVWLGGVVPPIV
jgi:hypothetical protein